MFYKISCVTLKCLFCVVTSKGKYEGMFLLVQIFTFCVKRVYTFCYNLIRFSFPWHFLTFTKTSDKRVYKELLLFEKQTTKDKLKSQKRQINYSQYQWQYFNRWKYCPYCNVMIMLSNNEVDLLTLKKNHLSSLF